MAEQRTRRRRSQAERRAATQSSLLEATIELLNECGYARLSTRAVVARAGVSRGAQAHYYATKAELVAVAIERLSIRRREALEADAARLPGGAARLAAALDLLWRHHRSPLFDAAAQLWVAARADAELRAALVPIEARLRANTREMAPGLFGGSARDPCFQTNVDTALAVMRGLALLPAASRDIDALWRRSRERLLALFALTARPRRVPAALRRRAAGGAPR